MSAAGNFTPPMFFFSRQITTQLLKKDGSQGVMYTNSKNGWINEGIFVEWPKHFAAYVKPTQEPSVLLILDNHSSHISLFNFLSIIAKKSYVMLSIPPHSFYRI